MNAISNHMPTAELQALDAAHHMHPFTTNDDLAKKGARIITRANGVRLTDSEGNVIKRKGGRDGSNPGVARWLGDIRKYFPKSVVDILQDDAMKHENLKEKMMLEPEILEQAQPSVHLVATLMELGKLIPEKTKDTARKVIQKVVDELMDKLENEMKQAVMGALSKSVSNRRPTFSEINWGKTILRNLKNFQPAYNTVIPETLYGYGRKW